MFLGYSASYQGIIQHFFCERKPTFVEFILEQGYFSEVTRNEHQLYTLMILEMLTLQEGITKDIINFCEKIHFKQLDAVDLYSNHYGDNLNAYQELINYNQNTPFKYLQTRDQYTGDFPSSLTIINHKQLINACLRDCLPSTFKIFRNTVLVNWN